MPIALHAAMPLALHAAMPLGIHAAMPLTYARGKAQNSNINKQHVVFPFYTQVAH